MLLSQSLFLWFWLCEDHVIHAEEKSERKIENSPICAWNHRIIIIIACVLSNRNVLFAILSLLWYCTQSCKKKNPFLERFVFQKRTKTWLLCECELILISSIQYPIFIIENQSQIIQTIPSTTFFSCSAVKVKYSVPIRMCSFTNPTKKGRISSLVTHLCQDTFTSPSFLTGLLRKNPSLGSWGTAVISFLQSHLALFPCLYGI